MAEKNVTENPAFLEYVFALTEGYDHMQSLEKGLQDIEKLDVDQLKRIGLKTYQDGKWSIHTILQHLIDWERIWCFRAVLFARKEGTIPDAHDQEIMGRHYNADELSLDHLIQELRIVRLSSILLFKSFNLEILETRCLFFEYEMPLHAIASTIAAHQIHHFNVIQERYVPLDN